VLGAALTELANLRGGRPIEIDVFKLPHHGSNGNVASKMLKLAPARHYIISTSGERFHHPDDIALSRVVTGIPTPRLWFNYANDANLRWQSRLTKLLTIRATISVNMCQDSWQNPHPAVFRRLPRGSARPFCLDIRENRLRNTEAGLLKLRDRVIEVDEAGVFSFVKNGQRAGHPQSSPNGFVPSRLLIDEQDIGMHFHRKRDRLALADVKLRQY
jgi:hypothetical protein